MEERGGELEMNNFYLEKIKEYDNLGIFICIVPEFNPPTGEHIGFCPQVIPYNNFGTDNISEWIGNPLKTREEAIIKALEIAEEFKNNIEFAKPLTLFTNKKEVL